MPMKLKIKVSESMSHPYSPLGTIEDRLIRIPASLRESLGFKTGHFLCLKSIDDRSIPLQIAVAYYKDAVDGGLCVYVSRDTFGKIDITKLSTIKPVDDILIGCDPEFFLVDKATGMNISASHFFSHYGDVGSDCGLAELRPRPGFNEDEVTANLRDLLIRAYKHISNRMLYKDKEMVLIASSYNNDHTAGFHIHFGLSDKLLAENKMNRGDNNLLKKMVSVLDYYIGIPAIIPEGSEDYRRRSIKNSQYGKAGDHRSDHVTLEYRVPGGHLLRHPLLTKGILGLNMVVIKDLTSRLRKYSNGYRNMDILNDYRVLHELYPNLPHREKVRDIIMSENIGEATTQLETIMHDVKQMIGFKDRSKSIMDYFEYMISYISSGKGFSKNLEINWGLKDER
jgi:bifunctional DNA-binding transcriptional regulator/antitoxin component of YhaV-PrlF toxin-antitoxin module